MAIIDFNEIPEANSLNDNRDEFELFAREFFETMGFEILDGPDRGPDGGRDIIIEEKRDGIIGKTSFRWLVSCKHKSHSNKSVAASDEENISDRVKQFNCNGFIGFYSTLPSSGLNNRLKSFEKDFEIQIFDNEIIERYLMTRDNMEGIVKRFFPKSYDKILNQEYKPKILFNKYHPLLCDICGKDLLEKDSLSGYYGLIGFIVERSEITESEYRKKYSKVYCACKGKCDRIAEYKFRSDMLISEWEDISDLANPKIYLEFIMSLLNGMYNKKNTFSQEAFDRLKEILLIISQVVVRDMSIDEKERYAELQELPRGL